MVFLASVHSNIFTVLRQDTVKEELSFLLSDSMLSSPSVVQRELKSAKGIYYRLLLLNCHKNVHEEGFRMDSGSPFHRDRMISRGYG